MSIGMLKMIFGLLLFAILFLQEVCASPPMKNKSESNIRAQARKRERYNLQKNFGDPKYEERLKYMKGRYAFLKNDPSTGDKYRDMLQNSRIRSSSRRLNIKYGLPRGTLPGGKYDHKSYHEKFQEREENLNRVRELTTTSVLLAREHEGLAQVMRNEAEEPRKKAVEAHEEMWKIYKKGALPDNAQQTMPPGQDGLQ
ncbi:uncharacterized protein FA14DRAFT_27878 [Meira miltonrushii]|uniref:Uncharacterized protein n=1 Tax=Meira miltonrushii TaxID=1280837 RepID=A0A316VMM2_9BASI|nr:uncharacterized protein FA14DRAFT_27878 [Meira miltonrushii]PWN38560.1 hypothetical protein FA14DRAFT_27878 [Meira miltonrushii]